MSIPTVARDLRVPPRRHLGDLGTAERASTEARPERISSRILGCWRAKVDDVIAETLSNSISAPDLIGKRHSTSVTICAPARRAFTDRYVQRRTGPLNSTSGETRSVLMHHRY